LHVDAGGIHVAQPELTEIVESIREISEDTPETIDRACIGLVDRRRRKMLLNGDNSHKHPHSARGRTYPVGRHNPLARPTDVRSRSSGSCGLAT
jgi:hypothetical protein